MATSDFLYELAINELWANPHEDRQLLFQMNRISKPTGVQNLLYLPFIQISTPEAGARFVMFELSSRSLNQLGINGPNSSLSTWRRVPDILVDSNVLLFIFTDGRMADLQHCWIRQLPNGNVILAVNYSKNVTFCNSSQPFYIRFYSFIDQSDAQLYPVLQYQRVVKDSSNTSTWASLADLVYTAGGMMGHPFINGERPPEKPSWYDYPVGTVFQAIMDDSARHVDDSLDDLLGNGSGIPYDVGQLTSYTSTEDGSRKYIVHLDVGRNGQYYHDDMELYLKMEYPNNTFRTKYIPRTGPSIARNLTGVDIAVNANVIDDMIERTNIQQDATAIASTLIVQMRPVEEVQLRVLDSNRIRDLQRLKVEHRAMAMTGMNSTLNFWKADVLETCPFNSWRSLPFTSLSYETFRGVFSLYAAQDAIERMRRTQSGWSLPPLIENGGGRLVTFDANGLRRTTDVMTPVYTAAKTTSDFVDPFRGTELLLPDYGWDGDIDIHAPAGNATDTEIEGGFNVLCYYMVGTTPTLAVEDQDYYLHDIEDYTLVEWDASIVQYDRYVRSAQRRIQYTLNPTDEEIVDGIPLYSGNEARLVHDLGPGDIYVWWNGHYLVEGIDYVIEKLSANVTTIDSLLHILVKPEWIQQATRTLEVLICGLPSTTFEHVPRAITGWVRHGFVSNDNRYDLYADRNQWIFADGSNIVDYKGYAEGIETDDPSQVGPLVDMDGRPFAITPLPQFSRQSDLEEVCQTTPFEESLKDDQIENYLSYFVPQAPSEDPITVNVVYDLYSPFINHLSELILDGDITAVYMNMSSESVLAIVQPYLYLLDRDPTQMNHPTGWVEIHPRFSMTPVSVSAEALDFLQRANDLHCNGLVSGWNDYFTIA